MKVIINQGLASGADDGCFRFFLEDCDVEFMGGVGKASWTDDPAKAKTFKDAMEAVVYYNRSPRAKPFRTDGKPNRPLTAYTILIQDQSSSQDGTG